MTPPTRPGEAVPLWRCGRMGWREEPPSPAQAVATGAKGEPYIALPAAAHAAREKVVEAARRVALSLVHGSPPPGGVMVLAEDMGALVTALTALGAP